MKWLRLPFIMLGVLAVLFLAGVGASAQFLPERVASHFNAAGTPDGWMARPNYLLFTCGFGVGMPLLIVAVFRLTTVLPVSMVNLPHKDFWLSPAMRPHTTEWLVQHGAWLSCLMIGLFGGLHVLTIVANRSTPARLPAEYSTALLAAFLVLMAVWVIRMLRRFRNPTQLGAAVFAR